MIPHLQTLPTMAAAHALGRARLADLRRSIADRIEADIALLDALDGDPDLEPEPAEEQHDAETFGVRFRGGLAA